MPTEHARTFGGGAGDSTLTPIVAVALILAVILILVLPRKWAIVPFLFVSILVPFGQSVVVGGLHLFVFRIVALVGCGRLLLSKMTSPEEKVLGGGFSSIDSAFLWCTLVQGFAVMLLFRDGQAVVNQLGFIWDYLCAYFFVRFLIQDKDDAVRAIKVLASLAAILAVCMIRERVTMQNIFAYLGGALRPELRDGKVRAQGSFQHALTAGAFASTMLPLLFLLWKNGKAKFLAGVGILSSAAITWTTNSSTPLLAFTAGLFAVCLWPMRQSMRRVRWGIVFVLLGLQCVMKSSVWWLIARVDLTGGSSGYHRAELVDAFIRHFFDWWLIGVKDTSRWGWGLWDAQNQFVSVGENGGLIAFIFFIVLISRCFARIGDARKNANDDVLQEWFFWFLGAALFSHVVGFFGVNYFDQSKVPWFVLIAIIAATAVPLLQTAGATATETAPAWNMRLPGAAPSSRLAPSGSLKYKSSSLRSSGTRSV